VSGTAWFLLIAWGLTLVGWGYTCWRWGRCIDRVQLLDNEVTYLRGELLDVHGSTDWEW
jgi:hypothetical protein